MNDGPARETTIRARQALVLLIAAAFVAASTFLLTFTFRGPFRFVWPVHSPVNAESIVAVSFVLLSLILARGRTYRVEESRRSEIALAAVIAFATALAFLPTTSVPLLHDSYTHVYEALHESWAQVLGTFAPRGGAFLRPLGYVSYFIDGKWAGEEPFRWHVGNVVLHAANTCLVYWLVRRLTGERWPAALAALIFGIHGARPEAVSWVAARYDLLAALFALLALLALDVYVETNRRWWFVVILAAAICAVLSKESAYALPLLAALMAPFKVGSLRRRTFYAAGAIALTYAISIVYRLLVLGDVGGYRESSGQAAVLHFNAIHSIKALFLREWAFLFFPMNWSTDFGLTTKLAIVLMLAVAVGLLLWARANRMRVAVALLWVIAASLPVQQLLLLSADMAGARVLYLPVLGLALYFGLLVAGVPNGGKRWALAVGLIAFQLTALFHNQRIWREVAFSSRQACVVAGAELQRDPNVVFRDLPVTRHGVFFLANGFPYCAEMNSGVKAQRVRIISGDAATNGKRVLEWNDEAAKFTERSGK